MTTPRIRIRQDILDEDRRRFQQARLRRDVRHQEWKLQRQVDNLLPRETDDPIDLMQGLDKSFRQIQEQYLPRQDDDDGGVIQNVLNNRYVSETLRRLRQISLPLDAFAEPFIASVQANPLSTPPGLTPFPGANTPEQFERRRNVHRILADMFMGRTDPRDTGGQLRAQFEERSIAEQLVLGSLFDPTNLIPASILSRVGRGAAKVPQFSSRIARQIRAVEEGRLAAPAGGAFDDIVNEVLQNQDLVRRVEGIQQAKQTLQELETLSVRLAELGTTESLRDRAIVELSLGSGARIGEVRSLTVQEARRIIRGDDAFDVVEQAGKQAGEATREVRLIEQRAERVRAALRDYDVSVVSRFGQRQVDDPFFVTAAPKARGIAMPQQQFNTNLRRYQSQFNLPDLPVGKEIRPVTATALLLPEIESFPTMPLRAISRQLGHQAVREGGLELETTLNFYIRDLGLDLSEIVKISDDLEDAVPNLFDKVQEFKGILRQAGGATQRKGKVRGGAELTRARRELGEAVLEHQPVHTAVRPLLEGVESGEARGIAERIGRLMSLRVLLRRLGEGDAIFSARARAARDRIKDLQRDFPDDHPIIIEAKNNLKETRGRDNLRVNLAEQLRIHANDEAVDIGVELEGLPQRVRSELDEFLKLAEPDVQAIARRAGGSAGITARQAKFAQLKRDLSERTEFNRLNLDISPDDAARKLSTWTADPTIRDLLELHGVDGTSSHSHIRRVLRQLARTESYAPMFGADFPTLRGKTAAGRPQLTEAATRRVDRIADALYAENHFLSDYVSRGPKSARDRILTEVAAADDGVPPDFSPRPTALSGDDGVPIDPRALLPEPMTVMEKAAGGVLTNKALRNLIEKIKGDPGDASQWAIIRENLGEGLEAVVSALGPGRAPFADDVSKLVLAQQSLADDAELFSQQVRAASYHSLKTAGFRLEKRWSLGDANFNISDKTEGFRVKEIHPAARNRLYQVADLEDTVVMRDINFILDNVKFDDIDRYYDMTRAQKNALLYLHHVKQSTLDLLTSVRNRPGMEDFRIEDLIRGDIDPDQWFPLMSIGQGEIPRELIRDFQTRITNSKAASPSFLLPRKAQSYAEAMKDGVRYAHPVESLAFFVKTAYQMISEHEAAKLVRSMVPERAKGANRANKGAVALQGVINSVRKGEVPSGQDLQDARMFGFEDTVNKLMADPDNQIETARAAIRTVQRSWLAQRELKFLPAPLEWMNNALIERRTFEEIMRQSEDTRGMLTSFARGAGRISNVIRFANTGFDFGFMFIQGLHALTLSPKFSRGGKVGLRVNPAGQRAWLKGLKTLGAEFTFNEDVIRREILQPENQAALTRAVQHGVAVRQVGEAFDVLTPQLIEDFKNLGPLQPVVTKFERAFNLTMLRMRTELWKAFEPQYIEAGEDLFELARWINRSTGTFNMTLAGTTPTKRAIESTLLFFAPLYRRATYSLLLQMAPALIPGWKGRSPMTARLALNSVASMLMVGFISGYLGGVLTGNEEVLDYSSPRFLATRIGNSYVGMGTAWRSLAGLGGDLYAQVVEGRGDEPALFDPSNGILFKWVRGQLAPAPRFLTDGLLGRTFLGESIRGEDEWDSITEFVRHVGRNTMPFWMNGMLFEKQYGASIAEAWGLRSFPVSIFEKAEKTRQFIIDHTDDPEVRAWRRDQRAAGREVSWRSIPRLLRDRLTEESPELQKIEDDLRAYDLTFGDPLDQRIIRYMDDVDVSRNQRNDQLSAVAIQWESDPNMSGEKFRELITEAHIRHASRMRQLSGEIYPDVTQHFDLVRREALDKGDNVKFIGDVYYDLYMSELADRNFFEYDTGDVDWELREQFDDAIQTLIGDDRLWRYVQERRKQGDDLPRPIRELNQARELLAEKYWNIPDTVAKTQAQRDKLRIYYGIGPERVRAEYARRNRLQGILNLVDVRRDFVRRSNPDVDWALTKYWGYNPKLTATRRRLDEWDASRGPLTFAR